MFARLMGLKTITPGDLHRLIQERQVTVIDVNTRQSWMQAHVPGALNLDPAARRAKGMGYGNVRVMSTGISGWRARKLPTEGGA